MISRHSTLLPPTAPPYLAPESSSVTMINVLLPSSRSRSFMWKRAPLRMSCLSQALTCVPYGFPSPSYMCGTSTCTRCASLDVSLVQLASASQLRLSFSTYSSRLSPRLCKLRNVCLDRRLSPNPTLTSEPCHQISLLDPHPQCPQVSDVFLKPQDVCRWSYSLCGSRRGRTHLCCPDVMHFLTL